MLSYTDLKKGTAFVWNGKPYEVVEASFSRMQQRKAVMQARIRDLISGRVVEASFQPSNQFEEADIEKRALAFLYHHRGEYVFCDPSDPKERVILSADAVGDNAKWLKKDTPVIALYFRKKLLSFTVPVKMDLIVADTPPGVMGDRAQGGTKAATLETGAVIHVPLFINENDIVRVNTETGEYAERVQKGYM